LTEEARVDGRRSVIALLTDFGTEDIFVGVMKGVIAGIAPEARVVDLTHAIPPFDIVQGAFKLRQACPFFPPETIFAAVVDPGVGGPRKPVAMRSNGQTFVAPDNGILALVDRQFGHEALVELKESRFFLPEVSRTFHGRDIFAPAAAHAANGVAIREFGPLLERLTPLCVPEPVERDGRVEGVVLWTDRFGNLVTNVSASLWSPGLAAGVEIAGRRLPLLGTFASVEKGTPLAIVGSFGMIEIAVAQGNAGEALSARPGTPVRVLLR